MLTYSKLLNRYYDPNANQVAYITNPLQAARYLRNGAAEDLVDILYSGTKRPDTIVFVFQKTPLIKELYCEPLFIKALFNKIVEYSILPLTNNILYEISLNVPLEKFYNQEIVLDKLLNDDQIFGCFYFVYV